MYEWIPAVGRAVRNGRSSGGDTLRSIRDSAPMGLQSEKRVIERMELVSVDSPRSHIR
jgi:hypothetical protein